MFKLFPVYLRSVRIYGEMKVSQDAESPLKAAFRDSE
jgi:hypothetical protein